MPNRPDQLKESIDQEFLITFDGDGEDIWIDGISVLFSESNCEIELEGKLLEAYKKEYGEVWVQEYWDWQRGIER